MVGLGGLGCPAALYLAASGVGHITVVDHDCVDLTNLQRQIAHTTAHIGLPKVTSVRQAMQALNPAIEVNPQQRGLTDDELPAFVAQTDVVLDCSDNFATRYAINRACLEHRKPLVSGAAVRFSGQISVFDSRQAESPCYHCLFPDGADVDETRCATLGVFAPLTGVVGTLQAAEALKLLTNVGESLVGRLQLFDAKNARWREVKVTKDPHCPACS